MKTFAFHVLRTFRWIIVPSLKFMSAFFCLLMVVAIFSDDPKVSGVGRAFVWLIFAVGLGSLSWYYDALLKKFSPIHQTNQKWS